MQDKIWGIREMLGAREYFSLSVVLKVSTVPEFIKGSFSA
jgi:hypothetical protein